MFNQLLALVIITAGWPGYQNIEIADGLTPSSQGACRSHFLDPAVILQVFNNLPGLIFSNVEQEASSDPSVIFNSLQQLLLVLLAHAGQSANFAFARKVLYVFEIRNLVRAPDQRNGLRPESLHA